MAQMENTSVLFPVLDLLWNGLIFHTLKNNLAYTKLLNILLQEV